MIQAETPLAGRYQLAQELGRGGMGVVYKAQDLQLQRTVAIKSLLLDAYPPQEQADMRARFAREGRMSLALKHQNIVEVYDSLLFEDTPYLIMEYLEGQTLKDFMQGQLKLSGAQLLDCLIQICDGLHFAHQQGVVHRDIKPDNLFIESNGNAKIMDFGIARQNKAEHFLLSTQPGMMMGTLNYMSPEQLQDAAEVDQRSDIFSLGIVMYELFTGQLPFSGESMGQTIMQILSQDPVPPQQHNPRLPAELVAIIMGCLHKRRGQRYQSCGDIARSLLQLRGVSQQVQASQSPAAESPEQHTGPQRQRQTMPPRQAVMAEAGNQTRPAMGSLRDHLDADALQTLDQAPGRWLDRQAGLSLEASADGLQAWISVDATYAIEPPCEARVQQLLDKAGIQVGLQPEVLALAGRESFLSATLIAEGQAPQAGQPVWMESLLGAEVSAPLEREDGSVDHRERRQHRSVQAGTPLLRRHPARPGTPGLSIYGQPLPAADGADFKLLEGPGTALASDDPCLLIATRAGMPVQMARTMRVEPVLELEQVGLETGHVRFDGSVLIQGNVARGFQVEAGGDIIVYGTVEDASLSAGGNIYLYGSVFGGAQTRLRCRYHLEGLFIQQAQIECGGDLRIREALMHCQTRVIGQARIGLDQGKGVVCGGELYSTYLIEARQMGSVAQTPTRLAVGAHPQLEAQLSDITARQAVIRQQLQENIKNMIYLRTRQEAESERMKKLEQSRAELMFESNTLNDEMAFLQESLKQASDPKACCLKLSQTLHPGVQVNISGVARHFDEDTAGPLLMYSRQISPRQREVCLSFA